MSAFFFGPAERQLFGYYHAAKGATTGAVIICPSWGIEYQYAHRALRMLARRLAERGFHVLRFDYSGVGDSWGDTTDANMERWQHDVGLAVKELQAMSSNATVDLIGLRIGAFLAATATAALRDIRRLVLWDPVIDGSDWARQLSPESFDASSPGTGLVEFGNQVISPTLLQQFLAIGPQTYPDPNVDAVLLLQTEGEGVAGRLAHVSALQYMRVDDSTPWVEDQSVWSGLVPVKAIAAITDWMLVR